MVRRAGRLGQAVAVQQREAETVQIARDDRIEPRPAGDEQAHARAEGAVHAAEHAPPGVQPEPVAQPARWRQHQRPECQPRQRTAARDVRS